MQIIMDNNNTINNVIAPALTTEQMRVVGNEDQYVILVSNLQDLIDDANTQNGVALDHGMRLTPLRPAFESQEIL